MVDVVVAGSGPQVRVESGAGGRTGEEAGADEAGADEAGTDEAGFAAVELAIGLAVLLLVAMVTVTLTVWPERAMTGRRVARVAAQAAAAQTSWEEAQAAGTAAAEEAARNYGLGAGEFSVSFSGSIERDAAVTASVSIRMPAIAVPGIASGAEWTWTTTSTQAAGAYRSLP